MRKTLFVASFVCLASMQAVHAETREENAARLIAQNQTFKTKAAALHGHAQESINSANRLAGEAHSLLLKAGTPQFKSAVAQYSGDLTAFKTHADQYNAHLANFQKTVGECHAGEAAYEANLRGLELHVQRFHIPDMQQIKPPHICGQLKMSAAHSSKIANSMRNDQIRVLTAEQNLNVEEQKLANAQAAELLNAKKAVNASVREKHEQELAAEFGKLKQEYDLLKIENQALGGENSKVVASIGASTSVQGKIQPR